ncbi:MAG: putative lipid-binding transport protein (Tim44 family) [Myxococcota bacterium]|jgi:predicted lipid-binding transport protein (Tim44 family)
MPQTLARWLVVGAALLACACLAEARVGGGHTYSGGSSSSPSSSTSYSDSSSSWGDTEYDGGSGMGGAGGGLAFTFFIGLFFIGVINVMLADAKQAAPQDNAMDLAEFRPPPRKKAADLNQALLMVQRADSYFSRFVFLDFATLLFERLHRARGTGDYASVRSWVTPELWARLPKSTGDSVDELVVGSVSFESLKITKIGVRFEASLLVNGERRHLIERWTFRRNKGAHSAPPERLLALRCPSCGAAAETDAEGRCSYCDQVVNRGDAGWVAERIRVVSDDPASRPHVSIDGGGVEPGSSRQTLGQPNFRARWREFERQHPGCDKTSFLARVETVFLQIQDAWSTGQWHSARLLETEALFQRHRYWIERYERAQLKNTLDAIEIVYVRPCKVVKDAFYEAITCRIRARMLDYTEDRIGRVVGGNKWVHREFTEYWTFVRRIGVTAESAGESCPSCSSPVQVNAAGECSTCDTRLTSGDFGWVLALIEQDQAYAG